MQANSQMHWKQARKDAGSTGKPPDTAATVLTLDGRGVPEDLRNCRECRWCGLLRPKDNISGINGHEKNCLGKLTGPLRPNELFLQGGDDARISGKYKLVVTNKDGLESGNYPRCLDSRLGGAASLGYPYYAHSENDNELVCYRLNDGRWAVGDNIDGNDLLLVTNPTPEDQRPILRKRVDSDGFKWESVKSDGCSDQWGPFGHTWQQRLNNEWCPVTLAVEREEEDSPAPLRLVRSEMEAYRMYIAALESRRLRVQPVEGDGNCLFRSVSHQVYGDGSHHALVRKWCMDYIEATRNFFKDFVEGDFDEYVRRMRRLGEWGDNIEIQAMSEIYNRRAKIWEFDADNGARVRRTLSDASDGTEVLQLSYYGGGHYDSIVSIDGEAVAANDAKLDVPAHVMLRPGVQALDAHVSEDSRQAFKALATNNDIANNDIALQKAIGQSLQNHSTEPAVAGQSEGNAGDRGSGDQGNGGYGTNSGLHAANPPCMKSYDWLVEEIALKNELLEGAIQGMPPAKRIRWDFRGLGVLGVRLDVDLLRKNIASIRKRIEGALSSSALSQDAKHVLGEINAWTKHAGTWLGQQLSDEDLSRLILLGLASMDVFVESADAKMPECVVDLVSALDHLFVNMLNSYEPMNSPILVTGQNPKCAFLGALAAEVLLVARLHGGKPVTCVTDAGNLTAMLTTTERWHFSGHADLPLSEGVLTLGLTDEDGKFVAVDPDTLSEAVRDARGGENGGEGSGLTLAVLNGCKSLPFGEKLFDEGRGVPYVVCWASKVDDIAARVFSTGFWLAMHANRTLDDPNDQITKAFEAGKAAVLNVLQDGTICGYEGKKSRFALEDPRYFKDGVLPNGQWAAGVPVLLRITKDKGGGAAAEKIDVDAFEARLDAKITKVLDAITAARDQQNTSRGQSATELDKASVTVAIGKEGKLGRGSQGVVRRGTYKPDDDHDEVVVAVKIVDVDDEEAQLDLQRELGILDRLRHPCILRLFGTVVDAGQREDELWIVLQFCELGSVADILKRCGTKPKGSGEIRGDGSGGGGSSVLSELVGGLPGIGAVFFQLATDIARGIEYLHTQEIVHADLKPANIMLTADGRALVADFGAARLVRTANGGRPTTTHAGARGTFGYMSPEMCDDANLKASKESDIFSFAMLLSALVTGAEPFGDVNSPAAVVKAVCDGERPPLPDIAGDAVAKRTVGLMNEMWAQEPSARPTADSVRERIAAARHLFSLGEVQAQVPPPAPAPTRPGNEAEVNKMELEQVEAKVKGMKIGALKRELAERGVSTSGMTEKSELVRALIKARVSQQTQASTRAPAPMPAQVPSNGAPMAYLSTSCFASADAGDVEKVRALIKAGVDVNKPMIDGATLCHYAARNGHLEVVRELIKAGADVNQQRIDGTTSCLVAAQNGHVEVVRMLIEAGADVNLARTDTGYTPVCIAAQEGHVEVVRALIEAGADVNHADHTKYGGTPCFKATHYGHVEVVRMLVEAGADVNQASTFFGFTPCLSAAEKGHVEMVRVLVEAGADVNQADTDNGASPCFRAAQKGHVEVVRELIEAGADVNQARTDNGATPCFDSAANGNVEMVRVLVEAGADVNKARTIDGGRPCQMAAQNGHVEVLRVLIEAGADLPFNEAVINALENGLRKDVIALLRKKVGPSSTNVGRFPLEGCRVRTLYDLSKYKAGATGVAGAFDVGKGRYVVTLDSGGAFRIKSANLALAEGASY